MAESNIALPHPTFWSLLAGCSPDNCLHVLFALRDCPCLCGDLVALSYLLMCYRQIVEQIVLQCRVELFSQVVS